MHSFIHFMWRCSLCPFTTITTIIPKYLHVKILLPKIFVVKHSLVLFAVFIVFMGIAWHSVVGKARPVKISKWNFLSLSKMCVECGKRANDRPSVYVVLCVYVCVCVYAEDENVYVCACKLHLNIFHKIKYEAIVFSTFLLPGIITSIAISHRHSI